MTGMLAVLTAAMALTTLPPLPKQGLALDTQAGVQLQTLSGRSLATLAGLHLAPDYAEAHVLIMHDRRGRLFFLDPMRRRLRALGKRESIYRGCRDTDGDAFTHLLACRRVIKVAYTGGEVHIVARVPTRYPAGHWQWASFAPGRKSVLAQWIAECEVPVAYLAENGRLRRYGEESVALGWLFPRVALIHFPKGACGAEAHARGIYAVPNSGRPRLILRTKRFAQYAMWGG